MVGKTNYLFVSCLRSGFEYKHEGLVKDEPNNGEVEPNFYKDGVMNWAHPTMIFCNEVITVADD